MKRTGGQLLASIACSVAMLSLAAPTVAAAPALPVLAVAAPTEEGLQYESHSVFSVDLAGRAVHVSVDATVTNQQPSTTSGGFVRQFYFPAVPVPVLSEATNLAATKDDGSELSVTLEDSPDPLVKVAFVDLRPDLFYPQTQTVHFTYDLPAQPPRSEQLTRVNDAFASFYAFALGDPGLTSVEISVPSDLTADIVGVDMKREQRDGRTVFVADGIADPDVWTAALNARNDGKLVTREETIDGQHIKIKGWPDDPGWTDFVDIQLRNRLPQMTDLIGLPWPEESSTITVLETSTPYQYGYAGWYDPLLNTIEIGDDLDALVVLHELAHTWFNRSLFSDRWVNEAFADEFAARALEKAGETLPSPEPVGPDTPGAFKLNDWASPSFQDEQTAEQERFGYNASWTVLRTISTEIGMEKLSAVLVAATNDEISYRGSGPPEQTGATNTDGDWRHLLDLLEEVGGSKQASAQFSQFVVNLANSPDVLARSETRTAYQQFVEQSGGWSAPHAVRAAMDEWDFDTARSLMTDARTVLDKRDELEEVLRPIGVGVPSALKTSYETAEDDLDGVLDVADRMLDAARRVVEAHQAVNEGHGVLGAIGLFRAGSDDKVDTALRKLDEGDTAGAIAAADAARTQVRQATRTGVIRIVLLLLTLAAAFALWTWGRPFAHARLETRRERRRAPPEPPPLAGDAQQYGPPPWPSTFERPTDSSPPPGPSANDST